MCTWCVTSIKATGRLTAVVCGIQVNMLAAHRMIARGIAWTRVCECVSVVLGCGTKTQSLIHWCTTNVAYSIFGFRFQLYSHARSLLVALATLAGVFVLCFVQQKKIGRGGDGVCNCTKFKPAFWTFLNSAETLTFVSFFAIFELHVEVKKLLRFSHIKANDANVHTLISFRFYLFDFFAFICERSGNAKRATEIW